MIQINESIEYPIRINRYLFLKGYCSRRQADRYIEDGRIFINGKKAVLGSKVTETDTVEVDQKVKQDNANYQYYAYYKPRGIVSHNPQGEEKSIQDIYKPAKKHSLSPIGRLDKDSHGLMLLSNDGRIVNQILNPQHDHEKEYVVQVDKEIKDTNVRKLAKGVNIEGYVTKPAETKRVGEKSFRIILTEGKKHQIRRMCAALGFQVHDLKRVRIGHIKLGCLKEGEGRPLTQKETTLLLTN